MSGAITIEKGTTGRGMSHDAILMAERIKEMMVKK